MRLQRVRRCSLTASAARARSFAANRCGCPEGTTPSENGSCQPPALFMAPLCVGPNCPTPPGGACPDGRPRNSDGNCPPPQICTGGKIFDGNTCRCGAGKIENESGQCVPASTPLSKKPKKKRKPPPKSPETSDSRNPDLHQHRHRHWRRRTRQPVTPSWQAARWWRPRWYAERSDGISAAGVT